MSETRLEDFGNALKCEQFDFANEYNRSPATGIAGFARSLLSPGFEQELPAEIARRRFKPGRMSVQLHLAVRKAFREAKERSGEDRPKIGVAARSKKLVRQISDSLSESQTINGKPFKALQHDVLIDQHQILLAARTIANIISSPEHDRHERLAQALDRIADMIRSAANKTNIEASDKLRKWAVKCREGKVPSTKCVAALAGVMDQLDKEGLTGAPTQDWVTVRQRLEKAGASELAKVADMARYLRLLRRGSAIEQALIVLWVSQGNYRGAEEALEQAILQDQIVDGQRETAAISVMNITNSRDASMTQSCSLKINTIHSWRRIRRHLIPKPVASCKSR